MPSRNTFVTIVITLLTPLRRICLFGCKLSGGGNTECRWTGAYIRGLGMGTSDAQRQVKKFGSNYTNCTGVFQRTSIWVIDGATAKQIMNSILY